MEESGTEESGGKREESGTDEITPIVVSCRIGWNFHGKEGHRRLHLPIQTTLGPKLPR
jgi:hypothetical protein